MRLSAGDISGLWSEPLAVAVYIIVAVVLAWPLWRRLRPGNPIDGSGTSDDGVPAAHASSTGDPVGYVPATGTSNDANRTPEEP